MLPPSDQVVREKKSFKGKLTHAQMHARRTIRHDISSIGFQPVELKMNIMDSV